MLILNEIQFESVIILGRVMNEQLALCFWLMNHEIAKNQLILSQISWKTNALL